MRGTGPEQCRKNHQAYLSVISVGKKNPLPSFNSLFQGREDVSVTGKGKKKKGG